MNTVMLLLSKTASEDTTHVLPKNQMLHILTAFIVNLLRFCYSDRYTVCLQMNNKYPHMKFYYLKQTVKTQVNLVAL